jgi:HD-GYP domain-containing protein (c-di-GMP phosphodiesterase class II)
MGVTDEKWLLCVEQHHERRDGTGYPKGLTDFLLSAEALGLIDRYCALISHRRDRPAMSPNRTARELYLMAGCDERDCVSRLIKAFGLYPPGSVVRLENGEIAVVMRRGQQSNTPKVATIISANGVKLGDPIRRDTAEPGFAITAFVPEITITYRINPARIFGFKE